ncbi:MAG: esterase family protein, partial [Prevotella sp.]|nr:esterase family protein [Prevotella sp.]
WEIKRSLGEMANNRKRWDAHVVVNQIGRIQNHDLDIIIDCGEGDFFLECNKSLHERLLGRGIDHDFILRPGAHNPQYWHNSIDYQLLFFQKFFAKK